MATASSSSSSSSASVFLPLSLSLPLSSSSDCLQGLIWFHLVFEVGFHCLFVFSFQSAASLEVNKSNSSYSRLASLLWSNSRRSFLIVDGNSCPGQKKTTNLLLRNNTRWPQKHQFPPPHDIQHPLAAVLPPFGDYKTAVHFPLTCSPVLESRKTTLRNQNRSRPFFSPPLHLLLHLSLSLPLSLSSNKKMKYNVTVIGEASSGKKKKKKKKIEESWCQLTGFPFFFLPFLKGKSSLVRGLGGNVQSKREGSRNPLLHYLLNFGEKKKKKNYVFHRRWYVEHPVQGWDWDREPRWQHLRRVWDHWVSWQEVQSPCLVRFSSDW